ncbi:hypothetical protein Tco_1259119, partial [Tanacetum coccineum]
MMSINYLLEASDHVSNSSHFLVAAMWQTAIRQPPPRVSMWDPHDTSSVTCQDLGGGYLRDYVRVVAGMDDRDSDSELLIPTPWSAESKNEKRAKRWQEEYEWKRSFFEINYTFGINAFDLDKCTDVMKDK